LNVYTYHINKSTGIGGIETLYRELQSIIKSLDGNNYELFHGLCGKEDFLQQEFVKYCKLLNLNTFSPSVNRWFRYLSAMLTMIFLRPNKGDIFICVDPGVLLFFPAYLLKKINIIVIQSNRFDIYFDKIAKAAMCFRIRHINCFTVYTEADKEKLIEYYPVLKDRICIIPRGSKLKTTNAVKQKGTRLVTICRLDETQKNLSAMIEIVKGLELDCTLEIYGAGSATEQALLKRMIKNHTNIKYMGVATDMYKIYLETSIFLLTSRYEGFGQTLIEARSQGVPIIAFDTFDALPFIVYDGVNGFIVNEGLNNQYREKIQLLLARTDIYRDFSKNSIRLAKETEKERINSLWLNIFNMFKSSSIEKP